MKKIIIGLTILLTVLSAQSAWAGSGWGIDFETYQGQLATPPTPAAHYYNFFWDYSTGKPYYVDSTGTVKGMAANDWTNMTTVSDYLVLAVDAGMEGVLPKPNGAIPISGQVGSVINPTPANVSYGTFTTSGNNITNAVWGSGTQTATLTITGLTPQKLYSLSFTPTSTGQVPTITATSGIEDSTIPAVVTAVAEQIYFLASATTVVFTFTNTATATWSTASTVCYEYTRLAIGREFSNSIRQSLIFDIDFPTDWNAGTITFTVKGVISNATAPTNGQTVIFQAAAFAVGNSDSLSQAVGTAQTSTFTADSTFGQYDEWMGQYSSAITIPNAAAGKKVKFILSRLTSGTYAQPIAVTSIKVKFSRQLAQ